MLTNSLKISENLEILSILLSFWSGAQMHYDVNGSNFIISHLQQHFSEGCFPFPPAPDANVNVPILEFYFAKMPFLLLYPLEALTP